MKFIVLLLICLTAYQVRADKSDHWAVLVAGSNGFWNYRHQTDICHAYHIMKDHGIPESQIIVFSYDDVAQSSQNPFKGQLFNKPDGKDVYAGCNIDYKGRDVTPQKFLDVLVGKGDGKVLKSNSKSKVFINFSDHGAPGLIAFPSGRLYAKDFHTTLLDMHSKDMYEEMAIYIEACESGSMFDGILENNLNIYATTAANPHQSSWAYYCRPNDMVQGKHIGSCLGDEYSIRWMEDSDSHDICAESLDTQFKTVKQQVKKSEVLSYGQMTFADEVVGNFQGTCDSQKSLKGFLKNALHMARGQTSEGYAIPSRDAKMHYLYWRYMDTQAQEDALNLDAEIENRTRIENRFEAIRSESNVFSNNDQAINDFDCYKNLVESYGSQCGMDEYDLGFLHNFVAMCNSNMSNADMVKIATSHC